MTELDRLEEALEKIFIKNPKPSYEMIFKAGVKFGIAMHASNNLEYESTFWNNEKQKKRLEEELKILRKEVNEKILKFLILAVKLEIQKKSDWHVYTDRNYFGGEFDEEIANKCGIQLNQARKERRSYDFYLKFELSNVLTDVLSKYSDDKNYFCEYLSDNDDDTIKDEFVVTDIEEMYSFTYPQWHGAQELSKDQLVELSDTLDKQYLKVLLSI